MAHDSTRIVNRRRHTDLQPLATVARASPGRRISAGQLHELHRTGSSSTPDPSISLASPTLVAVRQYYRDNGLSTAFQSTPTARRGNSTTATDFPRRHSSISPSRGLITRFSQVHVSSPLSQGPIVKDTPGLTSIVEETRQQLLHGLSGGELVRLGTVVARRNSAVLANAITQASGKVPFEYTHGRLRQWGHAYLGNTGTADVFVRTLHLRKPNGSTDDVESMLDKPHLMDQEEGNRIITVRARVTPKSKERKPFLIQRTFNVEELRASVSAPGISIAASSKAQKTFEAEVEGHESSIDQNGSAEKRLRSKSISSPLPIALVSEGTPMDTTIPRPASSPERRVMPIHIEYALHYLPVLAALMLSGHVRKGDAVDLPLPHPEAWCDTVTYIYTGKGEVYQGMKENILYLAGRID